MKPAGATGAQLTALNLDKSALLQQVAQEHYGGRLMDLLGELQFAFVAFVYGQSLHGAGPEGGVGCATGHAVGALSRKAQGAVRERQLLRSTMQGPGAEHNAGCINDAAPSVLVCLPTHVDHDSTIFSRHKSM